MLHLFSITLVTTWFRVFSVFYPKITWVIIMTINRVPVLYSPVICINLETPGPASTLPRPTLPETFYYEFMCNGKERPSPTYTFVISYYKILIYWHRSSTRLKFDSIERSVSLRSFGRSGRASGCEKLPWLEQVFVSFSSSST